MADLAEKKQEFFTYRDYLGWDDDDRLEIINGQVYSMSPAPMRIHQEVSGNLFYQIKDFLQDSPCKVYTAPFDVRLPEENEDEHTASNVVQPDISIICDEKKLDKKGCVGAPDWVIEILSSSTASKDHVKKRYLYEKHGVKEYWLIHPLERTATIYALKENKFEFKGIFDDKAELQSTVFPDFKIEFAKILTSLKEVKEALAEYEQSESYYHTGY
ncbi:MAG: Uma2 family endonuclease [Candidatus Rifleibacteriota bacterium]